MQKIENRHVMAGSMGNFEFEVTDRDGQQDRSAYIGTMQNGRHSEN